MRLSTASFILSAPGLVPSISTSTVMPPLMRRLLNSALMSAENHQARPCAAAEKCSKTRSQLPSILIFSVSLQTFRFSVWLTTIGL